MSSQDNNNDTTSATSNENFSFPRRSKTESLLSASVPTSGSPYASNDTAANSLEEGAFYDQCKNTFKNIMIGGTVFDGFLLAASQEVGQSILTLPNVFAQTGFIGGVILELVFATLALYTNYLLVSMHAQHRHNLKVSGDAKHDDPFHIVSYHEIMDSLVGKWMKYFSLTVVFFALLGLTTVQIIATSSNMYILDPTTDKRTWSFIWGGLFSLVAFVPTFKHYRAISVLGILTTTYVAWFMTVTAAIEGPAEDVTYEAPQTVESFFNGFVQLLFVYAGHTSNIEVADVMDNPGSYDRSYFWSYIYVFTLTMPNAVTVYHTYGMRALYEGANSFTLFERSAARDFGIIMMTLHQAVAFGLFAGPLFHMFEKMIHIHDKPFWIRALARLPLCGVMLLLAVAFPFFGAVNAVLGAFTSSFGTYIIPVVAYNLAFKSTDDMVKKPVVSLKLLKVFNWLIAAFVILGGVGMGGYTSIKGFIQQIDEFDYFAPCYQCNPEL